MDCAMKINSSISQNIFSYLKMVRIRCQINITVEDKKNNEFINIYIYIYMMRIICDENDSKQK